jgi:hypothetical protein
MSEEIIRIKKERPVTKIAYFTNVIISNGELNAKGISPQNNWDLIIENSNEAYGLIGPANKVIELVENIEGAFCKRIPLSSEYRFLTEEETKRVVKGLYFETKFENILEPETIQNIYSNFQLEAQVASGNTAYTFIEIKEDNLEDYNVDICLKRSIDTLDTLTVRNNPLSNFPTQESETGVVMGTLYAKQKIVNEKGEKVLIPLSNVPVVIFNPSDEFPNTFSIDGEGNRVRLNLIQNSELEDYADLDSFIVDYGKQNAEKKLNQTLNSRFDSQTGTLKSIESLDVPEYFKYSTITNENGEFIIEGVPVGSNLLMFEVDLLKQGMTKSEVALNFFPYPTTDESNVDNIPHYYFRQLSINVVPSWGRFQTGYTFVDITANIDMRKWVTFFIPPISIQGKNIDELISSGRFDALTIIAKDMTKEGYPISNQVVEIGNILERESSQKIEWVNEFAARKSKIEFRKSNYNAFKLPANLYDPNGNASKDGGRTKISSKKGVWLCAYQMRMQYGLGTGVSRETGFIREAFLDGTIHSSHFSVNRGVGSSSASALGIENNGSLGEFPYQRTWTINYPEPYKIPVRPLSLNENKNFSQKVEPRYLDGDLVGEYVQKGEFGGYGSMLPLQQGPLIYNQFAQTVTASKVYKYEFNVNWHEEYSNGFRKSRHEDLFPNKKFEVKNGEKYQRVEAGFGYFLKPEGWGRISNEPWGDYMISSDIKGEETAPSNFFPPKYNSSMYRDGEIIYFRFDTGITPKWLKNGSLDIYRIIDNTPEDLSPVEPPLTRKACILEVETILRNNKKSPNVFLKLEPGNNERRVTFCTDTKVQITNAGARKGEVIVNGVAKIILPSESQTFDLGGSGKIKLETNKDLNFVDNFYEKSAYRLEFSTNQIEGEPKVSAAFNFEKEGKDFDSPSKFYLISNILNARFWYYNRKKQKKTKFGEIELPIGNFQMNGLILHRTKSTVKLVIQEERLVTIVDNENGVGFVVPQYN